MRSITKDNEKHVIKNEVSNDVDDAKSVKCNRKPNQEMNGLGKTDEKVRSDFL